MPKSQPIKIPLEQELRSRGQVCTTAGRSPNTDIDSTARSNSADYARGTVAAGPARLQARTRRTTVDAEPRALCCAGADAGPAGARVGDAGAIAADDGEVMRALIILGPPTGSKSIR